MQNLLTDRAISMSSFKKNPAAIVRAAAGRPVAVLNHNRVGFYLLEPGVLECLLDELVRLQTVSAPVASHEPTTVLKMRVLHDLLTQGKTEPI